MSLDSGFESLPKASRESTRKDPRQSAYAEHFKLAERLFSKEMQELRAHLKDSTIIDVGGGQTVAMAVFADGVGAKKYINVDIIPHQRKSSSSIAEYVTADIADYLADPHVLRSIPGSCNFIISGIDGTVHGIDPEELVDQLIFYLKKGDYVFGIHAPEVASLLSKDTKHFETVQYDTNAFLFYAFKRK